MREGTPRIVGIAPGDPWDRRTWSGASHHLFSALERQGALIGAVGALPPEPLEVAAKALAFSPSRPRWVERYEYSPLRRMVRDRLATRRAAEAGGDGPYATLQVGAWYSIGAGRREPTLRASFHDSNLALFMREHDFVADPSAPHIRRELEAERRVLDGLDVIFAMSEWLRRSFIEDFGQDPAKVVKTGSGANVRDLPDALPERRDPTPRILFVGFDFERKGGPTLLDAFARLRHERADAELWLVGPPPGAAAPGVTWFGPIDRRDPAGDAQIARLHREASALVLASSYEPFGNALLEAMAYGLPCVGPDRGSAPEIIDAGVSGLLVPPGDAAALAAALRELADDPDRARAMGAAGFTRLRERFTWDVVAARMVAAIEARAAAKGP